MSLYWCVDLNLPALEPVVEKCGNYIEVKITQPRDPRPAFAVDVEVTRAAVVNEFGDGRLAELLIPSDEVVLLNKIPGYADQADEVVVRGRVVGHRFYDLTERRWRFRPLYEGVATMLEKRLGYWAVVDMAELPPGYDIHSERVVEGSLPSDRYRHVALSTTDGKIHGVGKLFRGGRLHVVKSWRAKRPLPLGKPSSLRDAALLNGEYLERKSREAIDFIRSLEKYGKPIVVSYSGGKDSLVALDLTARAGVEFYIYFNDTGLEPTETYQNVAKVAEAYGAELIVGSAGERFWSAVEKFGLPARDYRWCCKVIKLAPTTKALRERFPNGYVSVVGQRGVESFLRARLPRVSQSKWVAGSLVAAPLQDWTALEVWLYIYLHNLPYNPAYEKGFDRLGCVICPANEMAELDSVRLHYPETHRRLEEVAVKQVSGEVWRLGLWRWRSGTPGDVARWLKREWRGETPVRVTKYGGRLVIELNTEPNLETLRELLKMIGEVRGDTVVGGRGAVRVYREGAAWVVESRDEKLAKDAAGLLVRSAVCGDCDLCVYWCPTGALRRVGPGRSFSVDSKCVGCLLCSSACPAVQYLVK